MKKLYVLVAACMLPLGLTACGGSSPALTAPEGARFDGGHTAGSGNLSDSTATTQGGSTIGSGN